MELTHTTDRILLHRWRASRDAEAFRALAERYAGLVFAAAHRVLRDPSEAEDVAQECFLTLAQARKPPERNLGARLNVWPSCFNLRRGALQQGPASRAPRRSLPSPGGLVRIRGPRFAAASDRCKGG